MPQFTIKLIAACAVSITASSAFSHITLEQPRAQAGSYYKAVFRVGHGCEGAATTAIKVLLPAGFQFAKPMPKTQWSVATVTAKLAQPIDNHGKPITHDVAEISWTANGKEAFLPNSQYDEFVLRGKLPELAGPMWFKVLQTCEKGSTDWSEIPASGSATQGLKTPAALLEITPAAPSDHVH